MPHADTCLALLSSAAVTRPAWSKEKKATFNSVVDIPIVRLNPFGTLDKQREQEQRVRESGVPYAIVRPVGLNSDWAPGRPVLSQVSAMQRMTGRVAVVFIVSLTPLTRKLYGHGTFRATLRWVASTDKTSRTCSYRRRSARRREARRSR
jgi:uncharacterized protein YbjT (DUF2867 family)